MRSLLVLAVLGCGSPPSSAALTAKPCGCDAAAAAEGRLCRRLDPSEVYAYRGEIGPDWEVCPPLPAD